MLDEFKRKDWAGEMKKIEWEGVEGGEAPPSPRIFLPFPLP